MVTRLITKALALLLSSALILTAPGLECYRVLAAGGGSAGGSAYRFSGRGRVFAELAIVGAQPGLNFIPMDLFSRPDWTSVTRLALSFNSVTEDLELEGFYLEAAKEGRHWGLVEVQKGALKVLYRRMSDPDIALVPAPEDKAAVVGTLEASRDREVIVEALAIVHDLGLEEAKEKLEILEQERSDLGAHIAYAREGIERKRLSWKSVKQMISGDGVFGKTPQSDKSKTVDPAVVAWAVAHLWDDRLGGISGVGDLPVRSEMGADVAAMYGSHEPHIGLEFFEKKSGFIRAGRPSHELEPGWARRVQADAKKLAPRLLKPFARGLQTNFFVTALAGIVGMAWLEKGLSGWEWLEASLAMVEFWQVAALAGIGLGTLLLKKTLWKKSGWAPPVAATLGVVVVAAALGVLYAAVGGYQLLFGMIFLGLAGVILSYWLSGRNSSSRSHSVSPLTLLLGRRGSASRGSVPLSEIERVAENLKARLRYAVGALKWIQVRVDRDRVAGDRLVVRFEDWGDVVKAGAAGIFVLDPESPEPHEFSYGGVRYPVAVAVGAPRTEELRDSPSFLRRWFLNILTSWFAIGFMFSSSAFLVLAIVESLGVSLHEGLVSWPGWFLTSVAFGLVTSLYPTIGGPSDAA